jgi:hypothetical protein
MLKVALLLHFTLKPATIVYKILKKKKFINSGKYNETPIKACLGNKHFVHLIEKNLKWGLYKNYTESDSFVITRSSGKK